jgi:tetratricopeptide (TPR) repeat protein
LKLGNVLFDSGRSDEAEASYRTVLRLRPDFAEAGNNLAVILQAKKQYREAEACCREALRLKPDFADAYSNLAVILEATKRHVEAEACCREALRLKPDSAGAWCNLGAALQGQGRLREAEASLLQALECRPDFVEVLNDLGYLYCVLDQLDKAAVAFLRTLELDPDGYGLEAAVYLAILSYLDGNLERSRALLDASGRVQEKSDDRFRHARGYWGYLDRLLSLPPQASRALPQPGSKTLYVVGESHCLSAHGIDVRHKDQVMRCMSEWIWGCKQWHLGSGSNNKYRQKFDAVMARLPRESAVLLLIGEIDCRYDEGILKAWEKSPEKSLSDVARATVAAYVDYVAAAAQRYGHQIILGGVPAPNIALEDLPPETAAQVVLVIGSVNAALKERAAGAGMQFLDVHALTDRGDGIADGQWHIDQHHLFPEAVAEAFEKFCR